MSLRSNPRICELESRYLDESPKSIEEIDFAVTLINISNRSPFYYFQYYNENNKRVSPVSTQTDDYQKAMLNAKCFIRAKLKHHLTRCNILLPGKHTIRTLFNAKISQLKAESAIEYRGTLKLILECIGDVEIDDFTYLHCSRFVDTWMEKKCTGSLRTLQKHIRHAKAVWSYASRTLIHLDNPWARFEPIKAIHNPPFHIDDDTYFAIINSILEKTFCNRRLKRLIQIISLTGIRIEELCNLQYSWLDVHHKTLTIQSSANFVVKGKRYRTVPVSKEVIQLINLQLEENSTRGRSSMYVFTNPEGEPLDYSTLRDNSQVIRQYLPKYNAFHVFRRYYATNLYKEGANIDTIQDFLGHATVEQTWEYIDPRVIPNGSDEIIDKISSRLARV